MFVVGVLLFAGPGGVDESDVGAAGGVASMTYVTVDVEHADVLSAASVAVA